MKRNRLMVASVIAAAIALGGGLSIPFASDAPADKGPPSFDDELRKAKAAARRKRREERRELQRQKSQPK